MAEKIAKLGIRREPGFLYFLRDTEVWKTPMKRAGGPSSAGKAAKVASANFVREEGYLYFLDAVGDISRSKRRKSRQADEQAVRLPPRHRRAALERLGRARLIEIADHYELEVADRRSSSNCIDTIVRARRVDFAEVLEMLKREELQEICDGLGLDRSGREKETLIQRILQIGQGDDDDEDEEDEEGAPPVDPVRSAHGKLTARHRRAALQKLGRARLIEIVDRYELEVEDRRLIDNLVGAIVRARRVDFAEVLEMLKREELQEICDGLGLDRSGREKEMLIQRILQLGGDEGRGRSTVESPGAAEPPPPKPEPPQPPPPPAPVRNKVFISYSNADAEWLRRLKVHLGPQERAGVVECWDDTRIRPGAHSREEIRGALDAARVAVLLVSADYLDSANELPSLLAAAKRDGVRILPVIVSPCYIPRSNPLSQFHPVNPPPQLPLIDMSPGERDRTFVHLLNEIESLLSPEETTKTAD